MDRILARFAGAVLFFAAVGSLFGDAGVWVGAAIGLFAATWLTYEIHKLEKKGS